MASSVPKKVDWITKGHSRSRRATPFGAHRNKVLSQWPPERGGRRDTWAVDKGGDFIQKVLGVCGVRMPVLCPGAWPGSRQPCIYRCEWKIVHDG
ncbi:hypothetical protein AVEN_198012-1 [Araneus ventricosus]|uniref:Uncharacterized protein n=1 Tax=Araneus ventricosus TaxID=182803 RepID=A0A4Y2QQ39_ARAVE|nr:hypothetical protein AVEN_198012-1 [Araneus ventricosus]